MLPIHRYWNLFARTNSSFVVNLHELKRTLTRVPAGIKWGALVNLSSLQYEQTKGVVVKVKLPNGASLDRGYLTATLKYETKDLANIVFLHNRYKTKWRVYLLFGFPNSSKAPSKKVSAGIPGWVKKSFMT